MDKFETIVRRYEGALSAVERDGDDSDVAVQELEEARADLLAVLRRCVGLSAVSLVAVDEAVIETISAAATLQETK